MNGVLGAAAFVLYSAVAVLLARAYRRTRDGGYLWLGLPLVLLPLVALPLALWLQMGVDRLGLGRQVNAFPFTLVQRGRLTLGGLLTRLNLVEHAVWGVLSLVAVLALGGRRPRTEGTRTGAGNPGSPARPAFPSLRCHRCGELASPLPDERNRYRCPKCGRQFAAAKRDRC